MAQMKRQLSRILLWSTSMQARHAAIIIFLSLVFLFGGASRYDVQSLVLLRPLAILFGAYALVLSRPDQLKNLGMPFWLLIALAALMLAQLIPMPPSIWSTLPQREAINEIDIALFGESIWRPLTMSPTRTWNSLFSLAVPIAAMLLFSIQDRRVQSKLLGFFMVLGIASAILSLMQILGSPRGPLYLYNVTNNGSAVGLFANRNHHGVFQACVILTSGWYFSTLSARSKYATLKASLAAGTILLLVPVVFVIGSRAGLITAALALLGSCYLISRSALLPDEFSLGRKRVISGKWLATILGAIVAILIAMLIFLSRSEALDRLTQSDNLNNLRTDLLPILFDMARDFLPFGSGFGSFEYVYKMYEPVELLSYQYLNQAHNDWLQWVIEGGIPAIVLLLLFVFWISSRIIGTLLSKEPRMISRAWLAIGTLLIFSIAAVVDYPLRVPSMMTFFALVCAFLNMPSEKQRQ